MTQNGLFPSPSSPQDISSGICCLSMAGREERPCIGYQQIFATPPPPSPFGALNDQYTIRRLEGILCAPESMQ